MKYMLILLFIFYTLLAQAQQLQLSRSSFTTYRRGPQTIVADSVITIANAVLNSRDFKDSLYNLIFNNASNDCKCNSKVIVVNGQVFGKDAYNELFKKLAPGIALILKKGRENGPLGSTPICTTQITSYVKAVTGNMPKISEANAIAVNVCHEYFHSLGYCHTYEKLSENDRRPDGDAINWEVYNEDITYRIGWMVYDILDRWINVEHKAYPYTTN
jgi:hypothetical protein